MGAGELDLTLEWQCETVDRCALRRANPDIAELAEV